MNCCCRGGTPGRTGPGEFHVPHGIWVTDDERVLVADSRNGRVQAFDTAGKFLHQWDGLHYPCDLYVDGEICYLAEMGSLQHHAGGAFISIRDLDGRVLSSWGAPKDAGAHALWVDADGSIYVNQNLRGERILKYRRV
ncbi:hypothetical protein [Streptomyces sp. PSKA30]|uniref:hypothetical protein n=1 Tax=Streptomyces sp. PSKA30 TaxID=2874597 RepID=UPI001CD04B1E|nr:hypothetical protein [Streptomyces sp. PSKA30]MBZ9638423.1 hypothetical protein [Streptomyces sp. PSKA30]